MLSDSKDTKTVANIFDIAFCSVYDGPGSRVVVYFQECSANCTWCHSPHSQTKQSPLLFFSSRCLYCGRCEDVCEQNVHQVIGNKHTLNRDSCLQCGKCVEVCPVSTLGESGGALHLPLSNIRVETLFKKLIPHLNIVRLNGGITLSGGQALLQQKAAKDLLQLCKLYGYHTTVETSGLLTDECYLNVKDLVDTWLFGMRFTTDYPSKKHVKQINRSFALIKNMQNSELHPRIPMIPENTDNDWYLKKCSKLLKKHGVNKVYLGSFNRTTNHYYKASGMNFNFKSPSIEKIQSCEDKIVEYFRSEKIDFVIQ